MQIHSFKPLIYALDAKNVNRSKLADALGITRSTLWRKLQGERAFTWWEVAAICRWLGCKNPLELFPAKKEDIEKWD